MAQTQPYRLSTSPPGPGLQNLYRKKVSQQHSEHITSLKEISTPAFTRNWENHANWHELVDVKLKCDEKKMQIIPSKHLLCWCTWSTKYFFFFFSTNQDIMFHHFITNYMCIYSPENPNQPNPPQGRLHHLLMHLLLLAALICFSLDLLHLRSTIKLSLCFVWTCWNHSLESRVTSVCTDK